MTMLVSLPINDCMSAVIVDDGHCDVCKENPSTVMLMDTETGICKACVLKAFADAEAAANPG